MLNERLAAVHKVRDHFIPAERDQENAALSASRCVVAMLEARADANLALATGLDEIALIAKGAALAIEARHCFVQAHLGLAQLPAILRIPERAWGDTDDCPPVKPSAIAAPITLHVAA